MKILIAEDEILCRFLLEDLLTGWGHEVVTVEDGAAALQVLRQAEPPRLAVLDWHMPGLDGVDVCRLVRDLPTARPYLILLTGRQEKENVRDGLQAGADDYVSKPFHPDDLRLRLEVGIRTLQLREGQRG